MQLAYSVWKGQVCAPWLVIITNIRSSWYHMTYFSLIIVLILPQCGRFSARHFLNQPFIDCMANESTSSEKRKLTTSTSTKLKPENAPHPSRIPLGQRPLLPRRLSPPNRTVPGRIIAWPARAPAHSQALSVYQQQERPLGWNYTPTRGEKVVNRMFHVVLNSAVTR